MNILSAFFVLNRQTDNLLQCEEEELKRSRGEGHVFITLSDHFFNCAESLDLFF